MNTRNLLFCVLLLLPVLASAQKDEIDGNKLTMREIPPLWPGCEEGDIQAMNACFTRNLIKHVSAQFWYPEEALKNNEEGVVTVEFFINADRKAEIISVEGGTKLLQESARKNILSIPEMAKPSMLNGKPHKLVYTVPFTYKTGK